jgi:acyl-CoA synthetase (AMP-forming)/AMP-acid ligase II
MEEAEPHIAAQWRGLAATHGKRPAIVDDAGTWSYQQIAERIFRFAKALLGLGLRKGERVALLMPDMREYLEADYAIMSAGLVRVPLDPRLTVSEIAALLRHVEARALITHASFAATVAKLVGEVESLGPVISVAGAAGLDYEHLLANANDEPLPIADADDLASLNFSGGTTGTPKAAMLRHRNLVTVARTTIRGFEIGEDSVFLNVRPLWPIAQVILMSYLFAGATVVLGRFDPETLTDSVARSGTRRTSLVPTQLVRWLDHLLPCDPRLDRLQAIHVGGSRIPPAVFERALQLIGPKIGVLYGLTEAPITCYLPPRTLAGQSAERERLIHSVGQVLPGYEMRLAGSAVGSRGAGEILIRGGNVMAGYWRNEAESRLALREGWLHTGDTGEFDEAGNLFIIGRLKEVIRSGSSTIIPKEVEDVLARHPAVAEVAVVGLPDAEWGEAVTAFIVAKHGISVSERELIEHCRSELAGYKKPRSIRFVASLPRSHYGKVLRKELIAASPTARSGEVGSAVPHARSSLLHR